jgi:hypothetical protein
MLRKLQAAMIILIAFALGLRIILWAIEPLMPFLFVAIIITTVIGVMIFRQFRI